MSSPFLFSFEDVCYDSAIRASREHAEERKQVWREKHGSGSRENPTGGPDVAGSHR